MSRVGKSVIAIPDKVEVRVAAGKVTVKGPKGSMEQLIPSILSVEVKDKAITVKNSDPEAGALWGTVRNLIANMVHGVSTGFTRSLEFNGVGYKAAVQGQTLVLSLGYSHPINYKLPDGIKAAVNKNVIEISGVDKRLVGQTAAIVREFRPHEPYKGKGLKYVGEHVIRKAGKTGAAAKKA